MPVIETPLPPPHPTPYPMRLFCCSIHLASNRAPVAAPPSAGGDGGWPRQRRLHEARRPPTRTATGPFKAAEDSEPPGPTQTGSRALAPGLPYRLAL